MFLSSYPSHYSFLSLLPNHFRSLSTPSLSVHSAKDHGCSQPQELAPPPRPRPHLHSSTFLNIPPVPTTMIPNLNSPTP